MKRNIHAIYFLAKEPAHVVNDKSEVTEQSAARRHRFQPTSSNYKLGVDGSAYNKRRVFNVHNFKRRGPPPTPDARDRVTNVLAVVRTLAVKH